MTKSSPNTAETTEVCLACKGTGSGRGDVTYCGRCGGDGTIVVSKGQRQPESIPAPCQGCGELTQHSPRCGFIYGRAGASIYVRPSERAQPLAPQCEHSISLTKDYKGPTADCPIHGKPLAEPCHAFAPVTLPAFADTTFDMRCCKQIGNAFCGQTTDAEVHQVETNAAEGWQVERAKQMDSNVAKPQGEPNRGTHVCADGNVGLGQASVCVICQRRQQGEQVDPQRRTKPYKKHLFEGLQTPEACGAYLSAALESDTGEGFYPQAVALVIQDICQALKLPVEITLRQELRQPTPPVCPEHCRHDPKWMEHGQCTAPLDSATLIRNCGHRCQAELATNEPHRWEIEPHYITDFSVLVTNNDDEAREAILEIAELYLWDSNEPGEERTMRVRMQNVPQGPRTTRAQTPPSTEDWIKKATQRVDDLLDQAIQGGHVWNTGFNRGRWKEEITRAIRECAPASQADPPPNYPRAISLLRSLRNVSEEDVQEQRDTWAKLEAALSAESAEPPIEEAMRVLRTVFPSAELWVQRYSGKGASRASALEEDWEVTVDDTTTVRATLREAVIEAAKKANVCVSFPAPAPTEREAVIRECVEIVRKQIEGHLHDCTNTVRAEKLGIKIIDALLTTNKGEDNAKV